MPMSIAKQLPFELKPSRKTIQLAERSIKLPCGAFEDFSIQLGNIVVPCDFTMLNMAKNLYTPLICGRDALKTLGAIIECKSETIIVWVAHEKVVFAFVKSSKEPMVEPSYSCEVINVDDEVKVMGDTLIIREFDDKKMMKNVIAGMG